MAERFGPYELLRVVGRGGMGEVYEAHDTEHDRVVALKRLTAEGAGDEEYQRRFRREARLVARLNSPHVIPIHSYGEIDGQLFLDMRLVGGADLERILSTEGRLPPARAVAIVEQVASALDAAHHAGLVHRDVKPSNVLVDDGVGAHEFAYLVDFGITRQMVGDDSAPLTGTRVLIGSLDYMAPERFSGTGGHGIDVYALACLLFECLTGSRPFPIDDFTELMTAHLYTAPPAPSRSVPGLDEAFDAVVASGLAKDPDQRPASAGALAAAARAALDTGTGAVVPSTPTTAQWARKDIEASGAPRRGGTERSATSSPAASSAPASSPASASPVDAPTTAVRAATGTRTAATGAADATDALRPGARPTAGAAHGPRPRGPANPPRASLQAMRQARAPGPTARGTGTGMRPPTGNVVDGRRGTGAPPARTQTREGPSAGGGSGYYPRPGAEPAPTTRPAPTVGRPDPEPPAPTAQTAQQAQLEPDAETAGRGTGRKVLLIALAVLGTALIVAAAVYVAVLLTPAAG